MYNVKYEHACTSLRRYVTWPCIASYNFTIEEIVCIVGIVFEEHDEVIV